MKVKQKPLMIKETTKLKMDELAIEFMKKRIERGDIKIKLSYDDIINELISIKNNKFEDDDK
jgi:hypothetical protein